MTPTVVNTFLEAVIFYSVYGRWTNFRNPQTYYELINREKLYGDYCQLAAISDKWAVRDLVRDKIGERYMINVIDVQDSIENIDEKRYAEYPDQFVAKPNMASKRIYVNTAKNYERFRRNISNFFDEFGNRNNEFHYKYIPKKIMIEELLKSEKGELQELKCLVFNGRLELIANTFNVYENDKMGSTTLRFYDRQWREPPLQIREYLGPVTDAPDNLNEIIQLSELLSEGWPFMRVDWYMSDTGLKFGELTPIPRAGRSFNLSLADHQFIFKNYYMANL